MKVTAKILTLFFVLVMLLTTLTSYLTIWRTYGRYEAQQSQVVSWLSSWIREEVESIYREKGPIGIEQLVAEIQDQSPDLRIRWIHVQPNSIASGELLVDGRRPEFGSHLVRATHEQPWVLHTQYPVHIDDQCVGALELESSLQEWERENLQSVIVDMLALGGLALFAVGTVYLGGIHWVGNPLSELIEQTRRIGQGDFSGRVHLNRRDEMGQLAETLNQTCELLDQQRTLLHDETRQRIETLQQLRHADRLQTVGKIAAGVAHELGTPLSVISGRAAALQRATPTQEQIQEHASAIKGEADRMSSIIRQLLDFSRRREPQRHELDLRDTIQQCIQLLRPIAEKRKTQLNTQLPDNESMAHYDAGQIQQVLTNLIVNGIQAADSSHSVSVGLEAQDRQVSGTIRTGWQIEVTDTGDGIAPEDLQSIFEPFFTTKDTGEGTGLGLPIAKGLIEDHGGELVVESEPGRGTRFLVWIPQEVNS
jgi:two-component system NtrC family sensor kinase